jgi:putative oxidoreductase
MTPSLLPIPVDPDIAATLARIALGAVFLAHGVPKIRNPKRTIEFVKGTGFPGGAVFAVLFTLLEVFGGIALLLGFLTQLVALLFALEMVATSIFSKTKLGKKFILGYELDVAYTVIALVLVLLGGGPWSADRLLGLA